MKSTIETKEPGEKSKYPYLGIIEGDYKCSGLVVLFVSEKTGICVANGENDAALIGEYSTDWAEPFYKPFDGRVYFEND